MSKQLEVQFLKDVPAKDDSLGGHKSVASSIVNTVCNEKEGKSLALVGSWGTGKSTIIRLIQAEVSTDKHKIFPFIFDTWSHKGDPLKRSFIERLVGYFDNEEIGLDRDEWKQKCDILSRKLIETNTTRTPKLHGWGIALSIATLIVPIGLALFTKTYSATVPEQVFGLNLLELIGGMLTISPILVWLTKLVVQLGQDEKSSFFDEKTVVENSYTIQTPDPTSIEFEDTFKDLIQQVKKLKPNHKILLVVDNLDRVESGEAKDLWATMRSMVSQSDQSEQHELDHVWLLVPFAKSNVKILWGEELDHSTKTQNKLESKDEKSSKVIGLADSFIEKTFQIIYYVPPPVTSKWVSYFDEKLNKAIKTLSSAEQYDIRQLFSIKFEKQLITPRLIISFINKLGMSVKQWDRNIPVADQSVYLLFHKDNVDDIISSIPSDLKDNYLSNRVNESIVALKYNLPVLQALQEINKPRIEDGLRKGDYDAIETLFKYDGSDLIISTILDRERRRWAENEPQRIGITAHCFSKVKTIEASLKERWLSELTDSLVSSKSLPVLNEAELNGYLELCKNSVESRHSIINIITNIEVGEDGIRDENVGKWLASTNQLLVSFIEDGEEQYILDNLKYGKHTPDFLALLNKLDGAETEILNTCLNPPSGSDAVIETLIEDLTVESGITYTHDRILNTLIASNVIYDWTEYEEAIVKILDGSQKLLDSVQPVFQSIEILFLRGIFKTDSSTPLYQVVSNGAIFHYLYMAQTAENEIVLNICYMIALVFDPKAAAGPALPQSANGRSAFQSFSVQPELLEKVVTKLIRYDRYISMARSILQDVQVPGRDQAIKIIGALGEKSVLFPPEQLRIHHTYLKNTLNPEDYAELMSVAVGELNLLNEVSNQGFVLAEVPFYLELLEIDKHKMSPLLKLIKEHLTTLNSDEWFASIKAEDQHYQILTDLVSHNIKTNLTNAMKDALSRYLGPIVNGTMSLSSEKASILYNSLDGRSARKAFARDILDYVLTSGNKSDIIYKVFPPEIIIQDIYSRKADDILRQLGKNVIGRRDAGEMEWYSKLLLEKVPAIIEKAEPDCKVELKERLDTYLSEFEDESKPQNIVDIVNKLNSKGN